MAVIDQARSENKVFQSALYIIFFIILISPFLSFHQLPDSYTFVKLFFILVSINVLMLAFLSKQQYLVLPQLPNSSFNIILLILFFLFLNTYIHNVSFFSFQNSRRIMFWELSIFFFNFFSLEKEEAFNKITKVICLAAAIFLVGAFASYIFRSNLGLYFTFGNIAHSAEFIGFCLAFQFGLLIRLWEHSKPSVFLEIFSALSLTYIFFSQSRLASIGAIFILGAAFLFNTKHIKNIIKIVLMCALFIILIKFFISSFLYGDSFYTSTGDCFFGKDYASRWLLYIQTLQMILENPFGVGAGNYEFSSIPYLQGVPECNEFSLFNTPHSEFLHFLAEDGIILCVLFFSLALSLIYFLWSDIKKIFYAYPEFIFFSLMLFIFSLFQFPLLNPIPYFMTALMIGFFFSLRTRHSLTYKINYRVRLFLITIQIIFSVVVINWFSEKYISFNHPHHQFLNKIMCTFEKRSWLSCLNVATAHVDKGEYDKAEPYIQRVLNWQPTHYQALRLLGFSELYQGNNNKACAIFKKYNSLFKNPQLLNDVTKAECQQTPL